MKEELSAIAFIIVMMFVLFFGVVGGVHLCLQPQSNELAGSPLDQEAVNFIESEAT